MGDAMHTPGPWVVDFGEATKIKAADGTLATVTHIHLRGRRTPDEVAANARLIAAAPELLEALKWMVDNDETNEGDTPLEGYGGRTWNEINAYWIDGLNNARAAIAKAEGRK